MNLSSSRTFKLVIFDFDGTLADSVGWMIRSLAEVSAQFGLRSLSEEEVQMLRGRSNREIVRYLGIPAWKIPKIATHMRRRVAEDIEQIRLFDGVEQMLSRLAAGKMRVAIVSSNAETNVRTILGPQNVAKVDFYECGASIFGKPHKFRRVLERSGIAPIETICIGDEARDIEAAREVGAASGAVLWGYATPDVLEAHAPTMVFRTREEIANLSGLETGDRGLEPDAKTQQ